MRTVRSFAPGKVIISGEHSVVYGQPAVAVSLDLGTTVSVSSSPDSVGNSSFVNSILKLYGDEYRRNTNDIGVEIDSDLPLGSGLGSSTALASSLIQSLSKWFGIKLEQAEHLNLVWQFERSVYPTASKLDPTVVVNQGVRFFNSSHDDVDSDDSFLSQALLINSGQPAESTARMVELVRANLDKDTKLKDVVSQLGEVTSEMMKTISTGEEVFDLIQENDRLLKKLGVVGGKADRMINLIEEAGGVAKITGAGGVESGSGFLLAFHKDITELEKLAQKHNWQYLYPRKNQNETNTQ